MAAVDVRVRRREWPPASTGHWLGQRLSLVAGACLVVVDALLVLGAFLVAHWVRFIAPELEATALGLDEYARMTDVEVGIISNGQAEIVSGLKQDQLVLVNP